MREQVLAAARARLLAERNTAGHWEGELSTSALSTATAVAALYLVDARRHRALVRGGLDWLAAHQNADGGWGDTVLSFSNISTTLLAWSAFGLAGEAGDEETVRRAEDWIRGEAGSLDPDALVKTVAARYGKDRTFSVPILMLCALGGRLGPEREAWRRVLPLPFEVAALPRRWFAILRVPVVSYALPALIAIGYARYVHAPPPFPLRNLRRWAWNKTGRLLAEIQPTTGGFLEATPLTSFVTMALASSGQAGHPVVSRAVTFLQDSVRPDGSWPIDTNLATWATTLATKALLGSGEASEAAWVADFPMEDRRRVRRWLLDQQYVQVHPYTDSPPGGWAWTDLPGGVPDADDTPGALLALHLLQDEESHEECRAAAGRGVRWLAGLQNRDGGIPTFCRGFGTLPFDRSSPDLTAHTVRAWNVWLGQLSEKEAMLARRGLRRAITYLKSSQDAEGAWKPLWFGNQHVKDESNRTYGTAKVVLALAELTEENARAVGVADQVTAMRRAGARWLLGAQQPCGGWGGGAGAGLPVSLEETALALSALAEVSRREPSFSAETEGVIRRGTDFLVEKTREGSQFPPAPIGFYFAKLWYYEKLYPLVWVVDAWSRIEANARTS